MQVTSAVVSALVNVFILAGLPLLGYWLYQRLRHRRTWSEIRDRVGLKVGETRFLFHSGAISLALALALVVWPPSLEPLTRPGSAQHQFVGLGMSATSVVLALLYGVVKTGFAEELLFRGMIAGSLGRRLPLRWANLLQALIFLAPHLLVLKFMPEAWVVLPLVFAGGLVAGWIRIRSGSILGPWLIHATANVVTCLSVVART